MTRLALGFVLLTPLLLVQACSTAEAPAGKSFRKVTIAVDGMAEHNGVL